MTQAGFDAAREFGERELVAIGEEAERDHHEAGRLHIGIAAAEPMLERFEHAVAEQSLGNRARLAVGGGAEHHWQGADAIVLVGETRDDHLAELVFRQVGHQPRVERRVERGLEQFELTAEIAADQRRVHPRQRGYVAHPRLSEALCRKNLLRSMKDCCARAVGVAGRCFRRSFHTLSPLTPYVNTRLLTSMGERR